MIETCIEGQRPTRVGKACARKQWGYPHQNPLLWYIYIYSRLEKIKA